MLIWIFTTVRNESVLVGVHMETFRLFNFWNVGPNFQKYSQKVKQNICDQTKRSNFHNKNAKSFPVLK